MRKNKFKIRSVIMAAAAGAAVLLQCVSSSSIKKISVGVSANFIRPFGEIATAFETKTGIKVEGTFTSSGSLYNQIKNGAPYDLFLSADEERPALLFRDGIAEKPFVYARGRVVLCLLDEENCRVKTWQEAITLPGVKKIAISNPATTPYGMAAMKSIRAAGLESFLEPRLVYAQNIAQTFQYVSTGAVDAGFSALSSVYSEEGKKGCYWVVDESSFVVQSACIIKRTAGRKEVNDFAVFIMSEEAVKIKIKYGYL